jgi:flagellar hook-length control protein FliK
VSSDPDPSAFAQMFAQATGQTSAPTAGSQHVAAPQPPQTPVAQFAQANQPAIVSTIHGSLLPDGGTMNINLNPPELGPMQISVKMENGVMSASFQTSNDQATRLLTHTLGQLKDALEIQGVSVDRLHVSQTSSSENSSSSSDSENSGGKQSSQQDGQTAQQEEQRRETLRRMWRKLQGQQDPLDLVA